ncbi:protein HEADING DATE 3B-like isoform X2 [Punica granatum]|uniref:Protein HEADING DATE 3B-like isoform X2 n=1 Tax=Punica granatum TaxID=22663 RepID=A0A6P8EK10_PUNGR|nr:protein HEADING DATE 3B-like isoform X2 [Punica granatum]
MGPMFPRLHVKDAAEKGGPRAPPRNKMALYEQLSIPSQRFNHRLLPLSHNPATNVVHPVSSSQGSGCDRHALFPLRLPLSAPSHISEKFRVHESDAANTSYSTSQVKARKRARAEEDFAVPVYVQLKAGLGRGQSGTIRSTSDQSMKTLSASNRDLRQEARDQQTANSNRLQDELVVDTEKLIDSRQRNDSLMVEHPRICSDDNDDHCNLSGERTRGSELIGGREGDDLSDESMISVSGLGVSPDDVVEIMGQKQFWKARRALVNQQRVFAVQVFELHRLIKVQQLIAESPHLLLEDVSLKVPPQNKLTIKIIQPPIQNPDHREGSEKHTHRIEQLAENGVSNRSFSTVLRSHRTHVGDTHSIPAATDNSKAGFWSYHQQSPPKHQWLIPVMSPSEGLVYKPYPGPGCMGPYNGQGPSPFVSSFMGPAYGVPTHFPTYGALMMRPNFSGSSIEQIHRFHQWSEENPDMNLQHQSSCNEPKQNLAAGPPPENFRESEIQLSTGSSPGERPIEGAGGVLPLFPMAPRESSGGSELNKSSQQPTRVIKVIPHDCRSATESVAWIFRSIQEERRLHE